MTDAWGPPSRSRPDRRRRSARCSPRGKGVSSTPLRVADTVVGCAAHAGEDRAERVDAAAARDDDRLGGRAGEGARAGLGNRGGRLPARGASPRADRARGAPGARERAVAGPGGRGEHDRRARPPAGPHRRGLARTRARGGRARRAGGRQPLDRRPVRARRGSSAPRSCCWCPAARSRRPRAPRTGSCARWRPGWPGTRSRSGAAGSPRIRPSCRAPPAKRCSRRTWPRAARTGWRWPSSRPAPTGCCCRR